MLVVISLIYELLTRKQRKANPRRYGKDIKLFVINCFLPFHRRSVTEQRSHENKIDSTKSIVHNERLIKLNLLPLEHPREISDLLLFKSRNVLISTEVSN